MPRSKVDLTFVGHAQCPFYIRETKGRVECEGFIKDASTAQIFRRMTDAERYKHDICYDNNKFRECEWYRYLMKIKYNMAEGD